MCFLTQNFDNGDFYCLPEKLSLDQTDFSKSLAEDIDIEPCERRRDSELVIRFIIYANDTFHCEALTSDGL